MFESSILGIIQGITEWLPISSEGALILAKVNIFKSDLNISELIRFALFLHLGTFFAALIYFRKDVLLLIKGLFNYKTVGEETRKLIYFYIIATLVSGIIGFLLLKGIAGIEKDFLVTGKRLTLLIGIMLLVTAFLQFRMRKEGYKKIIDLKTTDGILLGIVQGASILPGLSRSGLTVSTLLLRKFDDTQALKLSFLISLPAILGGNIILNAKDFVFSFEHLIVFVFSLLLGFLTIHILLKVASKLNFKWFVLLFAAITIIFIFI